MSSEFAMRLPLPMGGQSYPIPTAARPDAHTKGGLTMELRRRSWVAGLALAGLAYGQFSGEFVFVKSTLATGGQVASGPQVPGGPATIEEVAVEPADDPNDICTIWKNNEPARAALQASVTEIAMRDVVNKQIAPGASVTVGCGKNILATAVAGTDGVGNNLSASETQYDIASLSKMFTAAGILRLHEEGKLNIDEPVGKFLPSWNSGAKASVTFRQLLQHRSGLVDPQYSTIVAGTSSPDQVNAKVQAFQLTNAPDAVHKYSNLGYTVVYDAASIAAGQPLSAYIKANILNPLDMTKTGIAGEVNNCAPTSPDNDKSAVLTCVPQDELARNQGGVSGHAGWFTTPEDIGKFMAATANRGSLNGRSILLAATIDAQRQAQPGENYGIGVRTNGSKKFSTLMSAEAFGHTGWNGIGAFVDPTTKLWSAEFMNGTFHRTGPAGLSYIFIRNVNDRLVTATNALPR